MRKGILVVTVPYTYEGCLLWQALKKAIDRRYFLRRSGRGPRGQRNWPVDKASKWDIYLYRKA